MNYKPKLFYNDFADSKKTHNGLANAAKKNSVLKEINITNTTDKDKQISYGIVDADKKIGTDLVISKCKDFLEVDEEKSQMSYHKPYYRPNEIYRFRFKEEHWDIIGDFDLMTIGDGYNKRKYTIGDKTRHLFGVDSGSYTPSFALPEHKEGMTPIALLIEVVGWRNVNAFTFYCKVCDASNGDRYTLASITTNTNASASNNISDYNAMAKLPFLITYDVNNSGVYTNSKRVKFSTNNTGEANTMWIREFRTKWVYEEEPVIVFKPINISKVNKITSFEHTIDTYQIDNFDASQRRESTTTSRYAMLDYYYKYKVSHDGGVTYGPLITTLEGVECTDSTMVIIQVHPKVFKTSGNKTNAYFEHNGWLNYGSGSTTEYPLPYFTSSTLSATNDMNTNKGIMVDKLNIKPHESVAINYSMPIKEGKKLSMVVHDNVDDKTVPLSINVAGVEYDKEVE